jgi:hypothetical protein
MANRTKAENEINRVLGRLAVALMKRTGARLSAADERALAPLFLETIRSIRPGQAQKVPGKKSRLKTKAYGRDLLLPSTAWQRTWLRLRKPAPLKRLQLGVEGQHQSPCCVFFMPTASEIAAAVSDA